MLVHALSSGKTAEKRVENVYIHQPKRVGGETHNLRREPVGSFCPLSTKVRGTEKKWGTSSRWGGFTPRLESDHRALVLERQGQIPHTQPSPGAWWAVGLAFSLGALTSSAEREGQDLLCSELRFLPGLLAKASV